MFAAWVACFFCALWGLIYTAMNKLKNFIEGSKTFDSFAFKGLYSMPNDDFMGLYEHFLETGENLLDSYSRIIYLEWDIAEYREEWHNYMYDENESNILLDDLDRLNRIYYFSPEKHKQYKEFIEKQRQQNASLLSGIDRMIACNYTNRSDVRAAIFKKYGKQCLSCGSKENISLDHIMPVTKGGLNDLDNLQPLCKSCNSRKATKVIDYRVEEERR